MLPLYAAPHLLTNDSPALDFYSRDGVVLSRDAAHIVISALRRDAYSMRERGGAANLEAADANDLLAQNIGRALSRHQRHGETRNVYGVPTDTGKFHGPSRMDDETAARLAAVRAALRVARVTAPASVRGIGSSDVVVATGPRTDVDLLVSVLLAAGLNARVSSAAAVRVVR